MEANKIKGVSKTKSAIALLYNKYIYQGSKLLLREHPFTLNFICYSAHYILLPSDPEQPRSVPFQKRKCECTICPHFS